MKLTHSLVSIVLLFSGACIAGPTVSGNEAISVDRAGIERIELPPPGKTGKGKPMPPTTFVISESRDPKGRLVLSPWLFMIETKNGLQECMRPWFESTSCRASTAGKALAQRFWIVKHQGQWLRCPKPAVDKCVSHLSLDAMTSELQ